VLILGSQENSFGRLNNNVPAQLSAVTGQKRGFMIGVTFE
jgi:hypothetical protein